MARRRVWLDYGLHGAGESPEAGICREVLEGTGLRTSFAHAGSLEFLVQNYADCHYVRVEGSVQLSPDGGVPVADCTAGALLAFWHRLWCWRIGCGAKALSRSLVRSGRASPPNLTPRNGRCNRGQRMLALWWHRLCVVLYRLGLGRCGGRVL